MKAQTKLILLKLFHTLIWLGYVIVIFYILYAAILDQIGLYFWIGVGLVALEGIILLIYGGHCPITRVSEKLSKNSSVGFDILVPRWVAKYNKIIFGSIFAVGFVIGIYRVFT